MDLNGAAAAIRAGYSEKIAAEQALRLLVNVKVKEKIAVLQSNLAETSKVSALRVIEEQKRIAFSSIADLFEDWTKPKDFEQLSEEQKSAIKTINTKTVRRRAGTKDGEQQYVDIEYMKIEMHDKVRALETISRMLGYDAPQRFEITDKDGAPLFNKMDLSRLSDDELITFHALLEKAARDDSEQFIY